MKIKERLFWVLIVVGLSSCLIFRPVREASAYSQETTKYLQIFHEIAAYIESDYVDEVDEKTLMVGAIKGLIASLGDPHSRFMSEEDFAQLQEETRGSFGGIGLEVSQGEGGITVVSPIEDTPAMKAGILPKDKIVDINGQNTEKMSIPDAVKIMRGQPGTNVTIKVVRKDVKEPITFTLTRELIKIQFVKSSFLEQEKIGYLRLTQFMGRESTLADFKKNIKSFTDKKAKGIIIDMRSNPGGLLDMAIDISNMFLKNDADIVSVRSRGDKLVKLYKSTDSDLKVTDIPMVILLNAGSASASEIFDGAMQDNKRAIIVGNQSFGKGSVQNIYNLPYKTAIALTIQKYFTPSGVSIHKKGITPDHVVNSITPDDEDKIAIEKMSKQKILESFAKENPGYSEVNVKSFQEMLTKKGLKINKQLSRYLLKREYFVSEKAPVFDREFDPQLNKAIELLQRDK